MAIRASSPVAQYGFTLAAVALATLLRLVLAPLLGDGAPFILFYPTVVLCAWFGGLWPGLLATMLGGVSAWYFFIRPAYSFAFSDQSTPLWLALYLVAGLFISLMAESLHRARRRAEASETDGRAAHERLRVTLSSIGDAVITTDAAGCVTFMNEVAQRLTGWKYGEAKEKPLREVFNIINEETRKPVDNPALNAMQQGMIVGLANHTLLIAKDGSEIPIDDSGAPIKDAEGKLLGAVLIFRDITERRRAEDKFRLAIEGSPISKVMVDGGGRIVLVNAQAERLFGYRAEELMGRPIEMLIPERFRRGHPQYRASFVAAPQMRPMGAGRNLYGLRKDGSEVPIEIGLNPIRVGHETLILSTIIDLTERKRAEAALTQAARQHEAMYEFVARLQRADSLAEIYDAALDAMLNGLGCDRASILLYDGNQVMRFVASRGLSEGYRRAVEGHSPWEPDEPNPRPVCEPDVAASVLDEHLKALLNAEGIGALAFIPLVIDGKLGGKFMTYYRAPHAFTDVEIDLSLSIARQFALGLERRRAAEALKEADRHKDEFLAILSHELRNPLAALTTAAQVLSLVPRDDETAAEARAVIRRQTELMTRLIEDLLDVSRVTMGKLSLDRAPLDLADVVSSVIQSWRSAGRLDGSQVTLDVSPVWIDADRMRVEQIFANLLDNALKFTPADKSVSVHVGQLNGEAVLRVSDDGEGVAPALIDRVFDPFVQGARPQRSRGGLGLGLALVKRLTEMHGGTAEVASEGPGRGAVFTVRIPSVANPKVRAAVPVSVASPGGRRILIVDDNDDARKMLEAVLALDGHSVQSARDGQSGLVLASESPPEVALIDIGLPDIDGYELARRLRASEAGRHITLIALTGFGQAEDQRRAFAAGFDAHLTKPVTPDKLARTISQTQ